MTPERWQQLKDLYRRALEQAPSQRVAFLDRACAEDPTMRHELESLIAANAQGESFLEHPALAHAAALLAEAPSTLVAGQHIGPYTILSPLGAGGMGEVFLATDPRLGRRVALKLLPSELGRDAERRARFEQEARAASSLNHPNVCAIYEVGESEDGRHFIAMEYVEGQTLRARLEDSGLELTEALEIAMQVAGALAAAHEVGVVHRDIKPENLMLRADGYVKVLDFGLAKLTERPTTDSAPTRAGVETEPGVVMGTVSYMSPEQARGLPVDARTDIWSLGVVLYEMVAGRAPFAGPTTSDVLAAILDREPEPLAQYAEELPEELERIVAKALRKDREQRYRTARDLLVDLKTLRHETGRTTNSHERQSGGTTRRKRGLYLAIAMLSLIAIGLSYLTLRPPPAPKITGFTQITRNSRYKSFFWGSTAVATDGPRLYFSEAVAGGLPLVQVSSTGGETVVVTPQFPDAKVRDVSPDRAELLVENRLSSGALEHELWVVPVVGGAPRRVGNIMSLGAAWSPDGRQIVYANGADLHLANGDGSQSRTLVAIAGVAAWPRWSPDGTRIRFTVADPTTETSSLWEVRADGSDLHPLLPGWNNLPAECCGAWAADGEYFVFQSTRNSVSYLWALRDGTGFFQTVRHEPVQLTFGPMGFYAPVSSEDGGQLFAVGGQLYGEVIRYDPKARQFVGYLPVLSAECLAFTQDGEWVVYTTFPEGHLWRSKVDGSERRQLSLPPMEAHQPRWSPDGRKIAFHGKLPGRPWKIYLVSPEGGDLQQLMPEERNESDPGWSPDGSTLVFATTLQPSLPRAIFFVDLGTGEVSQVLGSEGLFSPRWSPDGRYILAMTEQADRLLLYDHITKRWVEEVAKQSLAYPQWSKDGTYIYFQAGASPDPALYRIRIADRKLERLTSLKDLRLIGRLGSWMGLAPDDSPLFMRDLGSQDIYALEWQTR